MRAHLAAIGCNGQEISRAHLAAIGCNGLIHLGSVFRQLFLYEELVCSGQFYVEPRPNIYGG